MWKDKARDILADWGIFVNRGIARGFCSIKDVSKFTNTNNIKVVFDVGANDGLIASQFLRHFPCCQIYCFEPNPNIYSRLVYSLDKYSRRAKLYNLGLSDRIGTGKLYVGNSNKTGTFILGLKSEEGTEENKEVIDNVKITTLDAFCEQHKVDQIDFLKIDAEGFDLNVLMGSSNCLAENRIGLIEVEATFSPQDDLHIPFDRFVSFLGSQYVIFGFYEQIPEYKTRDYLRRSNVIFLNKNYVFDSQ